MPDQTDTPTPKRMTTAEVAALAQQIDGRLDDLSAVVTDVSTRLQDREVAHGELRDELMRRLSGARPDDTPNRDQVDARIHEALAPLHDELHEIRQRTPLTSATGNLDGILARLEDAERKAATLEPGALTERVAQELHAPLSELRRRLAAVEEAAAGGVNDPVPSAVTENALAEQVQGAVDRVVQSLLVADDNARKRLDWLTAQLTSQTATSGSPGGGTGAQRKVLELMRQVTHIGKENEANLGQGGRFKFRSVDDAMDVVGYAMRDVGVILGTEILNDETTHTPITKGGTNKDGTTWQNTVVWTSTKLTVRYTFTDPEDGSTHPMEMTGEGRDASDKSTSKAASMALKYGLFQALMIPVTGLDDSDAAPPQRMEQDRQQPPAQQPPTPENPAQDKSARVVQALQAVRNVYRVPGGPQAQVERLKGIMQQAAQEGLLEYNVEGATLNQHGQAALRTLQAPPPPDDARASTEPPEPPENY